MFNEIKRCEDCAYCVPWDTPKSSLNKWEYAKCIHPSFTLISKEYSQEFCDIQRKDHNKCKTKALLFKPKESYRPPQPEPTIIKRKWWKITLTVEK